jgi:hypothetical protein
MSSIKFFFLETVETGGLEIRSKVAKTKRKTSDLQMMLPSTGMVVLYFMYSFRNGWIMWFLFLSVLPR